MRVRQERWMQPPQLNQVSELDMLRMRRDGLAGLYELDQEQKERIEALIHRVWYPFYDLIVLDGQPIIRGFFIFNADESKGDFSQIGAVCSTWKRHSNIGLDYTCKNASDDDIILLLLHELTHAIMLQGEHDIKFENCLNSLISTYNEKHGTQIENDYESFTCEEEKMRLLKNQFRVDHRPAPTRWAKLFKRDGKERPAATSDKKKGADDSAAASRQAMINRMMKQGRETAGEGERTEIRKGYGGSRIKKTR